MSKLDHTRPISNSENHAEKTVRAFASHHDVPIHHEEESYSIHYDQPLRRTTLTNPDKPNEPAGTAYHGRDGKPTCVHLPKDSSRTQRFTHSTEPCGHPFVGPDAEDHQLITLRSGPYYAHLTKCPSKKSLSVNYLGNDTDEHNPVALRKVLRAMKDEGVHNSNFMYTDAINPKVKRLLKGHRVGAKSRRSMPNSSRLFIGKNRLARVQEGVLTEIEVSSNCDCGHSAAEHHSYGGCPSCPSGHCNRSPNMARFAGTMHREGQSVAYPQNGNARCSTEGCGHPLNAHDHNGCENCGSAHCSTPNPWMGQHADTVRSHMPSIHTDNTPSQEIEPDTHTSHRGFEPRSTRPEGISHCYNCGHTMEHDSHRCSNCSYTHTPHSSSNTSLSSIALSHHDRSTASLLNDRCQACNHPIGNSTESDGCADCAAAGRRCGSNGEHRNISVAMSTVTQRNAHGALVGRNTDSNDHGQRGPAPTPSHAPAAPATGLHCDCGHDAHLGHDAYGCTSCNCTRGHENATHVAALRSRGASPTTEPHSENLCYECDHFTNNHGTNGCAGDCDCPVSHPDHHAAVAVANPAPQAAPTTHNTPISYTNQAGATVHGTRTVDGPQTPTAPVAPCECGHESDRHSSSDYTHSASRTGSCLGGGGRSCRCNISSRQVIDRHVRHGGMSGDQHNLLSSNLPKCEDCGHSTGTEGVHNGERGCRVCTCAHGNGSRINCADCGEATSRHNEHGLHDAVTDCHNPQGIPSHRDENTAHSGPMLRQQTHLTQEHSQSTCRNCNHSTQEHMAGCTTAGCSCGVRGRGLETERRHRNNTENQDPATHASGCCNHLIAEHSGSGCNFCGTCTTSRDHIEHQRQLDRPHCECGHGGNRHCYGYCSAYAGQLPCDCHHGMVNPAPIDRREACNHCAHGFEHHDGSGCAACVTERRNLRNMTGEEPGNTSNCEGFQKFRLRTQRGTPSPVPAPTQHFFSYTNQGGANVMGTRTRGPQSDPTPATQTQPVSFTSAKGKQVSGSVSRETGGTHPENPVNFLKKNTYNRLEDMSVTPVDPAEATKADHEAQKTAKSLNVPIHVYNNSDVYTNHCSDSYGTKNHNIPTEPPVPKEQGRFDFMSPHPDEEGPEHSSSKASAYVKADADGNAKCVHIERPDDHVPYLAMGKRDAYDNEEGSHIWNAKTSITGNYNSDSKQHYINVMKNVGANISSARMHDNPVYRKHSGAVLRGFQKYLTHHRPECRTVDTCAVNPQVQDLCTSYGAAGGGSWRFPAQNVRDRVRKARDKGRTSKRSLTGIRQDTDESMFLWNNLTEARKQADYMPTLDDVESLAHGAAQTLGVDVHHSGCECRNKEGHRAVDVLPEEDYALHHDREHYHGQPKVILNSVNSPMAIHLPMTKDPTRVQTTAHFDHCHNAHADDAPEHNHAFVEMKNAGASAYLEVCPQRGHAHVHMMESGISLDDDGHEVATKDPRHTNPVMKAVVRDLRNNPELTSMSAHAANPKVRSLLTRFGARHFKGEARFKDNVKGKKVSSKKNLILKTTNLTNRKP